MSRTVSTANYYTTASVPVGAAPLTLATWFRSTSASANQNILVLNAATDANYFGIGCDGTLVGDPVSAYTNGAGGSTGVLTTTGYTANTWTHACGVFASSISRSVFINGGGKATNTTSSVPASLNKVSLGVYRSSAAGSGLQGSMAEAAIWSAALNDDEVLALAKGVSPARVRPQSLVFYAPLIRDAVDVRGGRVLTATGTPTAADHSRIYR